ncbi:MAG: type VI secretion system protein TssA [Comamonadaceae bacterium]|nr:MAG: type VI secretion system protein TssA [Comamonadaceae bacterium]
MDIQLLEGLGRAAIPGANPAGTDVRDDPRFEALQTEIAKLTTPGAGLIDWSRVAQLGGVLLAEKGKDLLVASYVGAAATHSADLPGLAIGLEILADLVEHHWEGLSPPLARLRARRNAVQWLLDRLDLVMQDARWDQSPPVPAALMATLLSQADRLDQQLRERDDDAPSLRPLRQWLDRLPTDAPEPEPVAAAQPAPAAVAAPASNAPRPASAPARSAAAPAAPALKAPEGDIEQAWEHALDHLNQLADMMMAADPYDPRAYRASRFANWAGLQALPPATDGRTQIPPPISQVVDAWARVNAASAEGDDAIRFAEAQLPAFPLWLDLQLLCASALERLGQSAARQEVEAATRALLARLPGLETLGFSSGMPFANGDTLAWLAGLGSAAAGAEGGAPVARVSGRSVDSTVAQARSLAANGEIDAAVALLQKAIDDAADAGDALQLRARLCTLLSEHLPGRVPSAFADELLAQVRRHELAHWAPALAIDALAAAYVILREDDARQADAGVALGTIARLDAARAISLMD